MNITEKSKEYAKGKALNAITAAIEQAYADGYKLGYEDGYASKERLTINELEAGIEFVDLGLPSGTMWATDYICNDDGTIKYLRYDEASKYHLPTIEQFKELLKYTERTSTHIESDQATKFLGMNGNSMIHKHAIAISGVYVAFWLKEEGNELEPEKSYARGTEIKKMFTGHKLPVILVREHLL